MVRRPPQPGSKGNQTQAEILSHAVKIASVEGLAGLTIGRLWSLCDLWIKQIERHVFRGAYFFTGAFFEYAGRQGPVPSRVTKVVREWFGTLKDSVQAAQKRDEIKLDADSERISYQLDGLLVGAYWAHLQGGREAFREARSAILRLLASVATEELPSGAFGSLSAWRKFLERQDQ